MNGQVLGGQIGAGLLAGNSDYGVVASSLGGAVGGLAGGLYSTIGTTIAGAQYGYAAGNVPGAIAGGAIGLGLGLGVTALGTGVGFYNGVANNHPVGATGTQFGAPAGTTSAFGLDNAVQKTTAGSVTGIPGEGGSVVSVNGYAVNNQLGTSIFGANPLGFPGNILGGAIAGAATGMTNGQAVGTATGIPGGDVLGGAIGLVGGGALGALNGFNGSTTSTAYGSAFGTV